MKLKMLNKFFSKLGFKLVVQHGDDSPILLYFVTLREWERRTAAAVRADMTEVVNLLEPVRFPVIRTTFPNPIKNEIMAEFPIVKEPVPMKTVQEIEVYDPRLVMNCMDCDNGHSVEIRRVVKRVPVDQQETFHMVYIHVVEVIKTYTFEEWDAGLEIEP